MTAQGALQIRRWYAVLSVAIFGLVAAVTFSGWAAQAQTAPALTTTGPAAKAASSATLRGWFFDARVPRLSHPTGRLLVPAGSAADGLLGLGLGLELPMVGVTTGAAEKSTVGWGFTLGAALSYDLWDRVSIRLRISGNQTYAGRAPLRFSQSGDRVRERQFVDWNGFTVGVGASYLWVSSGPLVPFVGIDGGVGHGGYLYHFDKTLDRIRPDDLDGVLEAQSHPALGRIWSVGARVGARLMLARWLAAQFELVAENIWLGVREILNTREPRQVIAPRERVVLLSSAFSIRVLL